MTRRASSGLGERLATYRRAAGLSAAQLSAMTNGEISRSVIANIENGRRADITVDQMLALAWALEIPPVALVLPIDDPLGPVEIPGEPAPQLIMNTVWWFMGSASFRGRREKAPAAVIARAVLRVAEELAYAQSLLRTRETQNADQDVIADARKLLAETQREARALGINVPEDD